MASAENAPNDSAQSPARSRNARPSQAAASDSRSDARLAGEHERREARAARRAPRRARRGPASRVAGRPARRASSSGRPLGRQSSAVLIDLQVTARRSALGMRSPGPPRARGGGASRRAGSGPRLLGEQGRLDAVEQSFEPADELGLREPQLRLGRASRRERQRRPRSSSARRSGESMPSSSCTDRSWISRSRRRPASSSGARRTSSSMVRTMAAMRISFVGRVTCSCAVLAGRLAPAAGASSTSGDHVAVARRRLSAVRLRGRTPGSLVSSSPRQASRRRRPCRRRSRRRPARSRTVRRPTQSVVGVHRRQSPALGAVAPRARARRGTRTEPARGPAGTPSTAR